MVQGKTRLFDLATCYNIVDPLVEEHIRGVHIDLRLGSRLKRYTADIDVLQEPQYEDIPFDEKGYVLEPGDYVLGSTLKKVDIPLGYFGFIETKGNISRAGISSHNSDSHVDPGFKGNITLEIKNNANVRVKIYPGIKFCQLFLFRIEGESTLYKGKYQQSDGPTVFVPDDILAIVPRVKPKPLDILFEK